MLFTGQSVTAAATRAGGEQAAREAEHLVTARHFSLAGATGAEYDEVGINRDRATPSACRPSRSSTTSAMPETP